MRRGFSPIRVVAVAAGLVEPVVGATHVVQAVECDGWAEWVAAGVRPVLRWPRRNRKGRPVQNAWPSSEQVERERGRVTY